MKTQMVLRAAAELIVERGWRQGMPLESETLCVGAAIETVNDSDCRDARETFSLFVAPHKPPGHGAIFDWNDARGQTQDKVVAMLRDTADYLDKTAITT